jgi:CubicO group peptidase (beta-lactamase class C family)
VNGTTVIRPSPRDSAGGRPSHSVRPSHSASLSKAVFSVLIMKLVEHGVLDLDTPLQE